MHGEQTGGKLCTKQENKNKQPGLKPQACREGGNALPPEKLHLLPSLISHLMWKRSAKQSAYSLMIKHMRLVQLLLSSTNKMDYFYVKCLTTLIDMSGSKRAANSSLELVNSNNCVHCFTTSTLLFKILCDKWKL
uniref:Uncharacterized protein n=1 Tax=Arion vulgaris TaxID=1028688 RepID=A0A0B6YZZ6_9EUPU